MAVAVAMLLAGGTARGVNFVSNPAGFMRVVVDAQGTLGCALAFNPPDMSVQAVLAGQLTGGTTKETSDAVYKWDPSKQAYSIAWLSAGLGDATLAGHWVEETSDGWAVSRMTLGSGEGFMIKSHHSFAQTVFLAGALILDSTRAVDIGPGLNMVAYPFSSPIAIKHTSLASDGALGGSTSATSDELTVLTETETYWLKKTTGTKRRSAYSWVDRDGRSTGRILAAGSGFWYNARGNSFTWTETCPYANPFPAMQSDPQIMAVKSLADEQTVTVRISTASLAATNTVNVYYQDVASGSVPDPVTGWKLAQANVPVHGAAMEWKDLPVSGTRSNINEVEMRLYLVENGARTNLVENAALPNDGYLGMSLPADFRAFRDDSPWNTPIASGAALDQDSTAMINNLALACPTLKGSDKKWTVPVHVIDSSRCQLVDVATTGDGLYGSVDPDKNMIAEGLPMPEGIWADPEADGHMVLVDPVARKAWEFAKAYVDTLGNWRASCIDLWDLNGAGYRQPFTGSYWWRSGVNGAGTPLVGGVIRPEEIDAGLIRHALLCATPVNRLRAAGTSPRWELRSPAASRTDAGNIGLEFIPEGSRLQLDPTLDLDALGLSAQARVVARALQEYGAFVTDNAPDFKVYFQNLGPTGGVWTTWSITSELAKIPVGRFRVLAGTTVVKY